jgi:hypothetical protein
VTCCYCYDIFAPFFLLTKNKKEKKSNNNKKGQVNGYWKKYQHFSITRLYIGVFVCDA